MSDIVISAFNYINELSKGNQIIAGVISLWSLGIVTYLCRLMPMRIYAFLKKHLTTSLTVTSQHNSFHNMQEWLYERNIVKKLRNVKLSNGRYGYDERTVKTVGYGSHIIWYHGIPLMITLQKEENARAEYDRETIMLTKFGRSHAMFDNIITEITNPKLKMKDKVKVYKFNDCWNFVNNQPKRPLDSIFIEKFKMEQIIRRIDKFVKDEKWYVEHGIPYQLGILLYGPPGTGKTSVIKAIAGHFNKTIALSSAGNLVFADRIMGTLPQDSLLVVEDIDSASITEKRDKSQKNDIEKTVRTIKYDGQGAVINIVDAPVKISNNTENSIEKLMSEFKREGISGLLNALDGIVSVHGRIMFMTTNHPEQLDNALIRPGRIDLKIEIGYVNDEIFRQFFTKFFPGSEKLLNNRIFRGEGVTCAQLQETVLGSYDVMEILEKYTIAGM